MPPPLEIAMLSIHSSPMGDMGTRDTGGMSIYVRELAGALGRLGHGIDIFTWDRHHRHPPVVSLHENVRLIHLKTQIASSGNGSKMALYGHLPELFRAMETFRYIEGKSYDVIHSHYWLSGLVGARAQRLWRRLHVLTYHTVGAVKNRACPGENEPDLRLINEKKLAGSCDQIIASTPKEKDHLVRYCKAPSWKTVVIPCGVDPDLFTPGDPRVSRRLLGLNDKETLLLYVGRFVPLKGVHRLLEAMTHLNHWPHLRLILVGGDGDRSVSCRELKQRVSKLGIQTAVTFAGRVSQKVLRQYYIAADVLVVPSFYESFGLVALEALACGTPVVATRVGAMGTIVKHGRTGMVADDGAPHSLARNIDVLLHKIRRSLVFPERIRATVAGYTWSNMARATLDAYRLGLDKDRVLRRQQLL